MNNKEIAEQLRNINHDPEITQGLLKSMFSYDPITGDFTRIKGIQGAKIGTVAGRPERGNHGPTYIVITILGKYCMAHRLAWLYMTGGLPKCQIDHIDGNGMNNSFSNLRSVSMNENMKNKGRYQNNKSGITGVSWDKRAGKWEVQIRVSMKNKRIGRYNNLLDAACARINANKTYGYHSNHGSIRPR